MASIHFFVRNSKNPTNIALRMYVSRNCQPYATTNLLVNGKMWSDKKQRLKGKDEYSEWVNEEIDKMSTSLLQKFSVDYVKGKVIDSQWLNEKIDEYCNRPKNQEKLLSELILDFVKENPPIKGKRLKKNTLNPYKSLAGVLKRFKDVSPVEVDLKYHENLLKFLKKEEYNSNTITKLYSVLKTMLLRLESYYGVTISDSVMSQQFYIPKGVEVDDIYFNEERIDIIKNLNLNDERLIECRDSLILGLRTGLRVSDFLDLHDYNIKGDFLEVQTKKTGAIVVIPIHRDVKEILERNNGLPNVISDSKFNKDIKEICRIAGFDEEVFGAKRMKTEKGMRKVYGTYPFYELVSSHICRRSFATNLYGKLPNLTIMQITGHKTEKSFLRYIKITSQEHAENLKRLWEKETEGNLMLDICGAE